MSVRYRFALGIMMALFALQLNANVREATQAYTAKQYEISLDFWTKELKKTGSNNAQILFNMGNCLFQMQDYSKAILCYEKSLKEDFNQEDVHFNILVSRAKLGLGTNNKEFITNNFLKKIVYCFQTVTYQHLIILTAWCILVAIAIRRFRPIQNIQTIIYSLVGVCILLTILMYGRSSFQHEMSTGIITNSQASGYNTMTLQGASKTIKLGEKVEIVDQVAENIQIRTESDSLFWIKNVDFKLI
jgi:tetratricopeptide (TPR) repeat protein